MYSLLSIKITGRPHQFRLSLLRVLSLCKRCYFLVKTLRPRFDHLPYSLCTAIVLRSLYSALFALHTTVHACNATISRATEQLWPATHDCMQATIVQKKTKSLTDCHQEWSDTAWKPHSCVAGHNCSVAREIVALHPCEYIYMYVRTTDRRSVRRTVSPRIPVIYIESVIFITLSLSRVDCMLYAYVIE
jgi:hypothetical protein